MGCTSGRCRESLPDGVSDRDLLCFIWVNDVNKALPTIMQIQFTRVVFGISASPFLLNATIYHHLIVTNTLI